jgi:hypothetical protein
MTSGYKPRVKGYAMKDGKLVITLKRKPVSEQIRQRKSKRVRVQRRTP